MPDTSPRITELLRAWNAGDDAAFDEIVPLVHDELRRLAHHYMSRERMSHPLQTTALVNEAFLRLVDSSRVHWQDRAHFFAVAALYMRRVLVDVARSRLKIKRGGGAAHVSLDEALTVSHEPSPALVALDDALQALARLDPRKSKVVELRFFGGLTVEETADALGVSPVTVMRDWSLAKTWLLRELVGPP